MTGIPPFQQTFNPYYDEADDLGKSNSKSSTSNKSSSTSSDSTNGMAYRPINPSTAARAGASPSSKQNGILIPDSKEPILFITDKIAEVTGRKIADCKDLKISSSFTKVDNFDAIKAMAYRDPPQNLKAPSCYCFEREWVINVKDATGTDQTIILRKIIYTNIVIPTNHDAALLHDKETMAGIAARCYANFVDNAVLFHAGKPGSYKVTQDQITKVQKDNFIIMGLYYGDKKVLPNKMKKAKNLTLTNVRLEFRGGKKDAKDEEEGISSTIISLSTKVSSTSAKTIGQQERENKYLLVADGDSTKEIKDVAKTQQFRLFQEQVDEGRDPDEVIEEMDDENINQDMMAKQYRTANEALQHTFDDRLHLFTESGRIDTLRNLYEPTIAPVSKELKALLPRAHAKPVAVKGIKTGAKRALQFVKKSPPPNQDLGVLQALVKIEKKTNDDDIREEAKLLIDCYVDAYEQLKDIDEKMSKHEAIIGKISSDDDEIEAMEEQQDARREVLEEIKKILISDSSISSSSESSVSESKSASVHLKSVAKSETSSQEPESSSEVESVKKAKKKKRPMIEVPEDGSLTRKKRKAKKPVSSSDDDILNGII